MTKRSAHLATILIAALLCAPGTAQESPDEQVSAFLEQAELQQLLEVQLFERLSSEPDQSKRLTLAQRLSSLYLETLRDNSLPLELHEQARTKGNVLIRVVPDDALLDLRVELVVNAFRHLEPRAPLERAGLLDDASRDDAIARLKLIERDLFELATSAQRQYAQLNRGRSSTSVEGQARLTTLLAVRSRAFYTLGWCGYTRAVIERTRVPEHVFNRFGWVLGFEGAPPILNEIDFELFDLDHVARAALGIAQCRTHNNEPAQARVWLRTIIERPETSEQVRNAAERTSAEVLALELDWIQSYEASRSLIRSDSMDTVTARVILLSSLSAIAQDRTSRTSGGLEGAQQLSRLLIRSLIDQGQFSHVLDLSNRFDISSYLGSGFLSDYSEGLDHFERAQLGDDPDEYAAAAQRLERAINASDARSFNEYRADAVEKLALAAMRSDSPERARRMLEAEFADPRASNTPKLHWLLILATDQSINASDQSSPNQFEERLRFLVGDYIDSYPDDDNALRLVTNYAQRIGLSAAQVSPVLRRPRTDLTSSIQARRMLVRLLLESRDTQDHVQIIADATWVLDNQPDLVENQRESRQRLRFNLDLVRYLFEHEQPDSSLIVRLLNASDELLTQNPSLEIYARELTLRRTQSLLLLNQLPQASTHVQTHADTLDDLEEIARRLVVSGAWKEFIDTASSHAADIILLHGQPLVASFQTGPEDQLSRDQSILCEQIAAAADARLARGDESARALAVGLSIRVLDHGEPSIPGLVRTAQLAEGAGLHDRALESWNTLVNSLLSSEPTWGRARYESFRLMRTFNSPALAAAVSQYRALYPDGVAEPWGTRIDDLLSSIEESP